MTEAGISRMLRADAVLDLALGAVLLLSTSALAPFAAARTRAARLCAP